MSVVGRRSSVADIQAHKRAKFRIQYTLSSTNAWNPYSSCQGAAHVRPRRFPVCQTGKPGQTFELAQTVWHPTTVSQRTRQFLISSMYDGTVLFPPSTTVLSASVWVLDPPISFLSIKRTKSFSTVNANFYFLSQISSISALLIPTYWPLRTRLCTICTIDTSRRVCVALPIYALEIPAGLNDELREKSEKGETCLHHLVGHHGALPSLGHVVQSVHVTYLPIFYPSNFHLRAK